MLKRLTYNDHGLAKVRAIVFLKLERQLIKESKDEDRLCSSSVILQPEQKLNSELKMGFPFFTPYIRKPNVMRSCYSRHEDESCQFSTNVINVLYSFRCRLLDNFPIGILSGDFAIPKLPKIATSYSQLHSCSCCSCECPF